MASVIPNELNSPQIDAIWESLDACGGDKVATSTPNGPTLAKETRQPRRKSRRSWFDKSSTKYEIAVERNRRSKGRKKSDVEDEILMLTHFTNPPKISFGNLKLGVHKTRTLIIRNPHDYEQTVKVEKFPHKKKFSVEHLEFTVEAKGTFLFEIHWEPEDEGNFREMILFVVDNSYRLQGFVFGSVEAPQKKIVKRKGLLGHKVQKPFSVLHTQSLVNIKKSYSLQKGEEKPAYGKVPPQSDIENEPQRVIIIPGETTATGKENESLSNIENVPPVEVDVTGVRKENAQNYEGHKKFRKPNTYVKIHDLNMSPIGLPPGTGKKTDCNDILHSTVRSDIDSNVSPLETKDVDKFENLTPKTPESQKLGKMIPETQGFVSPNSFLQDSLCMNNESSNNQAKECGNGKDGCLLTMKEKSQKKFLSPDTFLKDLNTTLDNDKKDNCVMVNIPSPDSVLNKSIPHNIVVEQLNTVKTALQKSKPVLGQQKRTKSTNITSRQSIKVEKPAKDNIRRETYTKSTSSVSRRQSKIGTNDKKSNDNCRRETFLKKKDKRKTNPFVEVPDACTSSPRRTTFIVKQNQNCQKTKSNAVRPTNDRRNTVKQNGHQHFEKDIVTTKTLFQNEVETVSTTTYTEVIDTYTSTTVIDNEVVPTPERSLAMNQQQTTTTKTEISKSVDSNTVTKNRTLPTPERSSCGKQLFSPHTGQTVHGASLNFGDNSSFGSPRRLPDSPLAAVVNKRVSTTVTKERPSDALIEQTERRLSTCLFGPDENNIETDSLEDMPGKKHDISMIQEEAENCFTPNPMLCKTSLEQKDVNNELDTPMREAGYNNASTISMKNNDLTEIDTPTLFARIAHNGRNKALEEKCPVTSTKEMYGVTEVSVEIDTPLKSMYNVTDTDKNLDDKVRLNVQLEMEKETVIDTPLVCRNQIDGKQNSDVGKNQMAMNMIDKLDSKFNTEKDVVSINLDEGDVFDKSRGGNVLDDSALFAKTTFFEPLDTGDLNLDTPLRLLAEQEGKSNKKEKRRSFWEKPCDLSIAFDYLDTSLREANANEDKRKKSRRSFWEKLDESKLTPIIVKDMNSSEDSSKHSVTDSPARTEPQKSPSEIENDHQLDKSNVSEKNTSFPITPYHLLPNNPDPDNSRRSTHVVEKPRVLNLNDMEKKKLFSDTHVTDSSDEGQNGEIKTVELTNELEDEIDVTTSFSVQVNNESNCLKLDPKVNEMEMKEICISASRPNIPSDAGKNNCSIQKDEQNFTDFTKLKEKDGSESERNNEKEAPRPSGLLFVSCSPIKQTEKPVGRTVTKSSLRSQPIKTTVATVNKKRSPKRPLSQGRISENKRRKTKEADQQKAQANCEDKSRMSQMEPCVTENITEGRKVLMTRTTKSVSKPISKKGTCSNTVQGRVKAPTKGVALSKLMLVKKAKTALPKHPLPYASKNMYYDERWMEKQERGFVHWLNFVLTPVDEYQQTKKVKVDAGSLCVDSGRNNVKLAPTREVLSFRAYAERKRLNQLRRAACRLFQSKEVVHVIQKIEVEVESGRLFIRKDRKVHADLGLKQAILDMLLSFNPLWLRIGLETTFGEMIMIQNNGDVIGLSRFIITRLLGNPDIACEFSHPSVPHLYKDGYAKAIARHLLKKFLILVFFLDHAKSKRLVPQDPCLFCKDVEFKNCKNMLIEFSRDYLAGEGDITRHLGYLGYQIKHTQTAMDEFDYAVTNLATDLKDGIRLARVMEILSEDHTWTKKMRAPAISRLQKIHNMDLVFQILAKQGVTVDKNGCNITSRDIVDGHREKTLKLLWSLIVQYQVSLLLNKDQLKEEIKILERSLRVKKQLAALQRYEQILSQKKRDSMDPDLFSQNEIIQLLMKWCRVVCAFYGIQVENFTVSFGDGRVLCHLIHHYHPALLPKEMIKLQTMGTLTDDTDNNRSHDNSLTGSFNQDPFATVEEDGQLFEQLLANEKDNFRVLYEKVSELGGIPLMLRSADMSNTIPDEKVVVTYVSYLCARLLDIRHESRAARVIQLAWRRHHLQKVHQEFLLKQKAVVVLQRAVRSFLYKRRQQKEQKSAVIIQTTWRGYKARKLLKQLMWKRDNEKKIKAATVIQRYMLAHRDRRRYLRTVRAALYIQAVVRSYIQRQKYNKIVKSVITIQSKYRAYKLKEKCRSEFVEKKLAAVRIQSVFRMYTARKCFRKERAAIKIQATWRMYVCKKRYKQSLSSAVKIQTWYRVAIAVKKFRQLKKSTLTLQRYISGYLLMKQERQLYQEKRYSCLKIQNWWRLCINMRNMKQKVAAIKIQATFKGYYARKCYLQTRIEIIKLQAMFRTCLAVKQYNKQKTAAVTIQKWYRGHLMVKECQRKFTQQRNAIIYFQACARRQKCLKQYRQLQAAAVKIQSRFKSILAVRDYNQKKKAVTIIQRHYRARLAMKREQKAYSVLRTSCIRIQSHWRGVQVRKAVAKMHKAAVIIQTSFRGQIARGYFLCLKELVIRCQQLWRAKIKARRERLEFLRQKAAATLIQTTFRGHLERKRYRRTLHTVTKLQSHIRGYQQKRRFLNLRNASLTLQRHYRAMVEGRNIRTNFLMQKGAAIIIQAFFRGFRVRHMFEKLNSSSTIIQSAFRMFSQRKTFLAIKQNVVLCQRLYRAKVKGQMDKSEYMRKKSAIIKIQSHLRRFKVQKEIRMQKNAATKIQAVFRGYVARNRYLQIQKAVQKCHELYRAKISGQQKRYEYLLKKVSALVIQRHYRCYKVRQEVKKLNSAATKIQTIYRRYRERKTFLKLKEAVKKCQTLYRNKMVGKHCRQQFLITKVAIVTIQAIYRGWMVRKELNTRHKAATLIQSVYRRYSQSKKFSCLKRAAISCQRFYRTHVVGTYVRREYLIKKGAIITLQAGIRGWKVRKEITSQNKAAITIQSTYKGYVERKNFTSLKQAAMTCQKTYRAHVLGLNVRREFLIKKGAIITLQTGFRGWKVRKEITSQNKAAITIQSAYKGYVERKNFTSLKQAAMTCQKTYRAHVLGLNVRREFLIQKGATITLQAGLRGWKIRKEANRQKKAATVIQSVYRGYNQQRKFNSIKQAVISCQGIYRKHLLGNQVRREFLRKKGAVTTIQAGFKGWKVRKDMKRQHQAATCIQSAYKQYIQRRKFMRMKQAVIKCQERYRAKILGLQVRLRFLIQKGAALVIEDWYCDCMNKRRERKRQQAATLIQRYYRGHKARCDYKKTFNAVTTIQRFFRNFQSMKLVRSRHLALLSAAVVIQKCYRGHIARKRYSQDVRSVVTIQRAVKSYLQRKRFVTLKSAVLCFQRRFKAKFYGQQQRQTFLKTKSAVVLIQAHVRRLITQRTYRTTQSSVITVQKHVRKYIAHKHYKAIKTAVHVIQDRWRSTLLARNIQREFLIKKGAAITIQSWWRGYIVRKQYKRSCKSIVKLQAMVRRKLQQKSYKTLKSSATIIQTHFRAYLVGKETRRKYSEMKESVVKLQALIRAYNARTLLKRIRSSVVIQSYYRRHICMRNYSQTRSAVIKIQSECRALIQRRSFQAKMKAIVKIQRYLKQILFVKHIENYLEVRRKSAIQIQAWIRGNKDRKLVKRIKAAIVIQAMIKMNIQRRKFQNHRRKIIMVQSFVRKCLAQRKTDLLRKKHSAATCIQRAYRNFKQRQLLKIQKRARRQHLRRFAKVTWVNLAAIAIQRWYRKYQLILQAREKVHKVIIIQRWMKSKLCRLQYLRFRQGLILVQHHARVYLQKRQTAAVKIQAALRIWLYIVKQRKRENAVVKLQAIWRGNQVRRRSIGKKIEVIRKRVEKANRSATEDNKLGNRMASALDYLLRYKQLSHILEVLIHLDVATRLSPACCEKFVSVNAVHVIYRLMKGCNRSQPHMELLKYSVSILLNLAKYEKTVYEVYNVEGAVDTLIELMQIYRDKGAIFNSVCMLLGILGMLDKCRMEVKENQKLSDKLRSIHLLTARKHKIDATRQIRQARLLAAKSFNCSLPVHIPHKKQHKITPDWVLRKDKMKEIQDPLTAINFVMESFQVKPK